MTKWADFLISEVRYSPDHKQILELKQHKDLDGSVGEAEIVTRDKVASNIKRGISYMTIHNGTSSTWKKGEKIRTFVIDGEFFIRTDKNKVDQDNLGLMNEF